METLDSRLSLIDRGIADRESEAASIKALLPERRGAFIGAALEYRYLQLSAHFRKPAASFKLWPIGVAIIGPFAMGTLCLILLSLFSIRPQSAAMLIGAVSVASAGAFASLLFLPLSRDLRRRLEHAAGRYRECLTGRTEICKRRHELLRELDKLRREREDLLRSVAYEREQLLNRNWKAMRDREWEGFLCDAFRALGGQVETTPTSGDQGVDLIVTLDGRRIAVQAKGYFNAVGNGAVQEAVAGRVHYRCDACAVITNSRFTRLARALAESNACRLIDEGSVPAFVRGELPL